MVKLFTMPKIKKGLELTSKPFILLAGTTGLEPATSGVTD